MGEFVEEARSNHSIATRKKIFGVGINDAWYMVYSKSCDGKLLICPYYRRWKGMMQRCYSEKYHIKKPTYIDCTVCDEWSIFSNFKAWMETQDWQGKHLDKDILVQGNKIYSPEFCMFVTSNVNNLLVGCAEAKGKYPQGVSLNRATGKYISQAWIDGKQRNLGLFDTPLEANIIYKKAKHAYIRKVALQQVEPLKSALLRLVIN